MTCEYVFAAAYGLILLLSMTGWGLLCNRLLLPRLSADWGWQAAWGLTLTLCLGGILNLARAISPLFIRLFVCLGVLLLVFFHRGRIRLPLSWFRFPTWPVLLTFGPAGVLFAIRYFGSVSIPEQAVYPFEFNVLDDLQGYLVFPEKMLQTGTFGFDPFSWRRLSSSLGGQSFLQAIVGAALPAKSFHLADAGMGCVIAAGVLAGYLRSLRASSAAVASVLIIFALYPPPLVNTSSLVVPVALLLSLFRLWAAEPELFANSKKSLLLAAMHIAAICSLKTPLIPAVCAFAVFTFAVRFALSKSRKQVLTDFGWVAFASSVLLAPWMIDMYRSSGTLLYPILGSGYARFGAPELLLAQSSLTGLQGVLHHAAGLPAGPFLATLILFVFGLTQSNWKGREESAVIGLLAGSLLGTFAVLVAAGGLHSLFRYIFPFLTPVVFVLLARVAIRVTVNTPRAWAAVSAATFCLLGPSSMQIWRTYHSAVANTVMSLGESRLTLETVRARYRALQHVIPPNLPVLTRLEHPYLLDFQRNPIYLLDYPGRTALPPGMPFYRGGKALQVYLQSHAIRFVAYAPKAGQQQQSAGTLLKEMASHPGANPVGLSSLRLAADLDRALNEIGANYKRVYDDGSVFAVDLSQPN